MAIIDRREIEFDLPAVKLAIEWSPQAAQAFGLPPLTPTEVRCNPADGNVEVIYGILSATRVFTLRPEALGAIMISYCNRAGMPMARNAEKGIRIEQGRIVVVFTLRQEGAVQPTVPESVIGRAPEAVRAWAWNEAQR